MFATGRYLLIGLLVLLVPACKSPKPPEEPKRPLPTAAVIVKQKHAVLTAEQRQELGFAGDVIDKVQLSAGAEAEPFFATVFVPGENLKGEKGFEAEKLAGFSVRTKNTDELIASFRSGLRVRGYLIFKSHSGYGNLPDIVTVVKGNNSYDILKIQRTEASNYKLDTNALIAWLKQQQQSGSFSITGAGPDWIEARFIRQPADMRSFARKVLALSPDLRQHGPSTADKLAERMKKMNGFYLEWD